MEILWRRVGCLNLLFYFIGKKGSDFVPRVKEYEIEDVSKMTVTQCRSAYKKLVNEYQKIKDGAYCHECGKSQRAW